MRALLIIVVVLGVIGYSAAYTVQEYEQVVIVRFGKVIGSAVTEPGLKFKMPIVDKAKSFEKRWLEWDGDANQITTLDKRYIYIDVFARWRIIDPLVFIASLRDERSAQGRLDDIINNATRNVVANHKLIEAIRSTNREFGGSDIQSLQGKKADTLLKAPDAKSALSGAEGEKAAEGKPKEKTQSDKNAEMMLSQTKMQSLYKVSHGREKLTRLILEKASAKAAQLGIELKDVQIKRINYIESVQSKVFDRMISERKRVAESFRSQGRGRSAEILGQTEKELKMIRSEAYRKAQEIMGKADAEAAAVYADAYQNDPEFYNFLKTLESYQQTVDDKSWLILSTNADYARHLKSMK